MINIICIQINHAIITEWGQPEFRCVPRPLFPTQRVWLFRLGWMGGSWERRSKGASSKEQCVVTNAQAGTGLWNIVMYM